MKIWYLMIPNSAFFKFFRVQPTSISTGLVFDIMFDIKWVARNYSMFEFQVLA